MNNNLYIIIPYYNYYNNSLRASNIEKVISYYSSFNVKILLAEGVSEKSDCLADFGDKVWKHIKYFIPQKIWIKENIINLTIKRHLPKDWEYVCWMDGDILILDNNFVDNTINLLKNKDIIQMFNYCINRKYTIANGEYIWWDSSLEMGIINDYIIKQNIKSKGNNWFKNFYFLWSKNEKTFGYPIAIGYSWAINKKFYDKIEKLIDFNIVGGADKIICLSTMQNIKEEAIIGEVGNPPKSELNSVLYSAKYGQDLLDYYRKFKECSFGYLNSTIIHLFHGDQDSRKYQDRHYILKKFNFDKSMLSETTEGVLFLKNEKLLKDIEKYIFSREANN